MKKLTPVHSAKYLGVIFDETDKTSNSDKNKTKSGNHSLFGSHLYYGAQLWGQQIKKTKNKLKYSKTDQYKESLSKIDSLLVKLILYIKN